MLNPILLNSDQLHPEQSYNFAHARHKVSNVILQTFFLSMLFMTIALIFASKPMIIEHDNYNGKLLKEREFFTNSTQIFLDELIYALHPDHILHNFHNRSEIRYSFGNTFWNHCFIIPYPKGINFPSLLRRIMFSSMSQACVRTAVLISTTVRLFAIYCRSSDIRSQYRSPPPILKIISISCLAFDLLSMIFGMFVTVLHVENDSKHMPFLVKNSLFIFGVVFFIEGGLYTFLEVFDKNLKNRRTHEKTLILILFSLCFPVVNTSYSNFLINKPCMYFVSMKIAICEYICIAIIIIFYASQYINLRSLELILSTERIETMCCVDYIPDRGEYNPAMVEDFENISAMESFPIYKSVIFIS